MRIWQWIGERFRRKPRDLFNLIIEPGYAIKTSPANPYFRGIERLARQAGFLGSFVVRCDGVLRAGSNELLPTRRAILHLDVYPNPAAIEGRSISDYESPGSARRTPRATLVLDDDTELFLWLEGQHAWVAGSAVQPAPTEGGIRGLSGPPAPGTEEAGGSHSGRRPGGQVRG